MKQWTSLVAFGHLISLHVSRPMLCCDNLKLVDNYVITLSVYQPLKLILFVETLFLQHQFSINFHSFSLIIKKNSIKDIHIYIYYWRFIKLQQMSKNLITSWSFFYCLIWYYMKIINIKYTKKLNCFKIFYNLKSYMAVIHTTHVNDSQNKLNGTQS